MQTAVYKRDLMSFFNNGSAYIIFAVYCLLSYVAAFFWGDYLTTGNSSMLSYFIFQPNILAMIIPAISMRSWADEKRSGTIENLLTFPISTINLIISKFATVLTISTIMVLFSLPLLITTGIYIPLDWGSLFCSYIAIILTSCVLSAFGCLTSSISQTPAIAYLLGLLCGIFWINFTFNGLLSTIWHNMPFYFEGILNFSNNYHNLLNGQLNFYSIIYFAGLTFLLLFCNLLKVEDWRAK
ncbi:MAG: ABC transporter permease subunit [Alphaproteobacteria bacterium]|nr:ABC transporter permease subunit [Alphaproteobacteria bacterium]